jgi:hypothetical protein
MSLLREEMKLEWTRELVGETERQTTKQIILLRRLMCREVSWRADVVLAERTEQAYFLRGKPGRGKENEDMGEKG